VSTLKTANQPSMRLRKNTSSVTVHAAVRGLIAVNERPKSELATSRADPPTWGPVPSPTSPSRGDRSISSANSRDDAGAAGAAREDTVA
jgi:hypothetical protein